MLTWEPVNQPPISHTITEGRFRTVEAVNWPLTGKTAAVTGADSPGGRARKGRQEGLLLLLLLLPPPLHEGAQATHTGAQARRRSLQLLPLLSCLENILHASSRMWLSCGVSLLHFRLDLLCLPPHVSLWPQFCTFGDKMLLSGQS